MTSISFILPYYRLGRKLLNRAVDSILNARLACDYEIIVVDDGTPDSEASQWLDGKSSRLRYVWQENGRAQRCAQQRNRNGREGVCPIS